MEIEKRVVCSNCGYEIAKVVLNEEGRRALVVPRGFQLIVVDKERNIGSVKCPECDFENETDLNFWRKF